MPYWNDGILDLHIDVILSKTANDPSFHCSIFPLCHNDSQNTDENQWRRNIAFDLGL